MKKWTVLPCILLMATLTAAQSSAPVPAGTALIVKLETTLATFSNKPGDPFQARLTHAVVINSKTVIPAGAMIEGRVTKVAEPRRISGKPTIGILPEALILPTGERCFLDATLVDTDIRGTDCAMSDWLRAQYALRPGCSQSIVSKITWRSTSRSNTSAAA